MSTSLLDNYTQKWAYNQLDAKQKAIYARLFESAANVTKSCDISDLGYTYTDADLNYINTAFWAFDYDNPQFLELGSGYVYNYSISGSTGETRMKTISIDYARTPAKIRSGEFNKTAQSIIAAANALPSDYEKLKYIHDWIINNTVYTNTDSDYEREADGPLVYGKAVCEGYSKAFMYHAQSLGFECVCVSGTANEPHMWNKVKLGGKWYNVDATWDDPVRSDGVQTLRYNYFLISDAAIGKDHITRNEFALPSATSNYAQ